MRIVGGNFGISGSARLDKSLGLVVSSSVVTVIPADRIASVLTAREKSREFSTISFLIAGLLFGAAGWFLSGVLGALVGVVVAVAASFGTKTTLRATVKTTDDRLLELEGWHYEIQRLATLAMNK